MVGDTLSGVAGVPIGGDILDGRVGVPIGRETLSGVVGVPTVGDTLSGVAGVPVGGDILSGGAGVPICGGPLSGGVGVSIGEGTLDGGAGVPIGGDTVSAVANVPIDEGVLGERSGAPVGGDLLSAGTDVTLEGGMLSVTAGLPVGGGLSVGEDLPVFGDSLLRRYQRAVPPAGDLPVTGPIPGRDIGSAGLLGAELTKVVGLRIEEVTAPNVTVDVLSNSVLEITLKLKLHIAVKSPLDLLGEIIEVEVLKNITIAIRRGDTSLVLEDCKTPLGYMDIKVLEASSLPLENEILTLVTCVLDRTLPQILQKILCPVINAVVSSLYGASLSTARGATSPPAGNSPSSVFKMSFDPGVIVLELTGRSLIE
ncbi:uncharacterized protein LOC141997358 [Natator depressus]|uniref:uncharacterized protein LOC141997358 n=1 Tax=Natator depressus TaxID=27790 RepID=UPI003EB81102